jgi:hypothetical protein
LIGFSAYSKDEELSFSPKMRNNHSVVRGGFFLKLQVRLIGAIAIEVINNKWKL